MSACPPPDISGLSSESSPPGHHLPPGGNTRQNAVIRFALQFAAIGMNVVITPFIIGRLGVEAFGVVGVVNSLIAFMTIATASLASTVGRNLTFAMEQRTLDRASRELSTAVFGLLGIMAMLAIPAVAAALLLERLVDIPAGLTSQSRLLFIMAFLSFALTAIAGPLSAAMFVRNRLDLMSAIAFARTILLAGVVVLLFIGIDANLVTYGVAMLLSSGLACALAASTHFFLLPSVAVSRNFFDRDLLGEILSLGGWLTIAHVGTVLFLQADLIIANRFVGAVATGHLAAVSVISLQLRTMGGLVAGLFAPTQTALSARGDRSAFPDYLVRSIRLTTLFVGLLVGVFCGSAREVLSIWLGPEFASLTALSIVLTAYLIPTLGVSPSWNALLADGKIVVPAIVTIVMGAANVVLSIVLARTMGIMGIAVSGCIMLTLRNAVITPWYVARVCRVSPWRLWRELAIGTAYGAVVAGVTFGVKVAIAPESLWPLLVTLGLSAGLGALLLVPLGIRPVQQSAA